MGTSSAVVDPPKLRLVGYVEPELQAALPVALGRPWPAEETLVPLAAQMARANPEDQARLERRARALADGAELLLRREVLPAGDLLAHVFVDPLAQLQLVGANRDHKVRVDENLTAVVIRRRPLRLEGARPASLRQELRGALAIPMGDVERRPIAARTTGGIYAEFDPPGAGGFLGGRFDTLYAYSNGKVLLVAFRPLEYHEDAFSALLASGALAGASYEIPKGGRGAFDAGSAATAAAPGAASGASAPAPPSRPAGADLRTLAALAAGGDGAAGGGVSGSTEAGAAHPGGPSGAGGAWKHPKWENDKPYVPPVRKDAP
jgi:hypothetical protein